MLDTSLFTNYVNGSILYKYPCDNNLTNCSSFKATYSPGYWKVECWGASGGDGYNNDTDYVYKGGLGGYSVGVLHLQQKTTLTFTIGAEGTSNYSECVKCFTPQSFNGGGQGYIGSLGRPSGSGGGAT